MFFLNILLKREMGLCFSLCKVGNPTMPALVSYAENKFSLRESVLISAFLCLPVLRVADVGDVHKILIHKTFLCYPQLWIRLFISCRAFWKR